MGGMFWQTRAPYVGWEIKQYVQYISRLFFLVADTQLYKRLCPSVGPSVRWSVGEHESYMVKTQRNHAKCYVIASFYMIDAILHYS